MLKSLVNQHSALKPKVAAVLLFFCAAANVGLAVFAAPDASFDTARSEWARPIEIGVKASVLLSLGGCLLVFVKPRIGYSLGLLAGLIALGWLIKTEVSLLPWNSWVMQNYQGLILGDAETFLQFTRLRLLSTSLVLIAVPCAILRLLPSHWSLKRVPVRDRTWPAFVVGILAMALWFGASVLPYRVPDFAPNTKADFRILHIEKRGLFLRETAVWAFRDGKVLVSRAQRYLFQYRFQRLTTVTFVEATSPLPDQHARLLVATSGLGWHPSQSPSILRPWNADEWYIAVDDSRLYSFADGYGAAPPQEVRALFHSLERLSPTQESTLSIRDVCLGFCYDSVAALGFSVLAERERLFAR